MNGLLVECPKCGKRSIVQRSSDHYQCLGCDFRKNLDKKKKKKQSPNDYLWVVLLAGAIAFLLVWADSDLLVEPSDSDRESRRISPRLMFVLGEPIINSLEVFSETAFT